VFCKQNPKIPRDSIFVDNDYKNFQAYESVGFTSSLTDEQTKINAKDVKLQAPDLSMKQWMSYLGNVIKLSPVPKDQKFGEFPEGVLRLGGTFYVRGDDVLYQWNDRLPGDHPVIDDVLAIATAKA